MEIMYNERDDSVTSHGRNGTGKTYGIYASISKYDIPKMTLFPIRKNGVWQNCNIDIPLESFWRLVAQLEKEGLRP